MAMSLQFHLSGGYVKVNMTLMNTDAQRYSATAIAHDSAVARE